jgi:hypothetical protein
MKYTDYLESWVCPRLAFAVYRAERRTDITAPFFLSSRET